MVRLAAALVLFALPVAAVAQTLPASKSAAAVAPEAKKGASKGQQTGRPPCHGSNASGCYRPGYNQPAVYLDSSAVQALMAAPKPAATKKPNKAKNSTPGQDVFSSTSSADAWK